jgi:hypothetical protein
MRKPSRINLRVAEFPQICTWPPRSCVLKGTWTQIPEAAPHSELQVFVDALLSHEGRLERIRPTVTIAAVSANYIVNTVVLFRQDPTYPF